MDVSVRDEAVGLVDGPLSIQNEEIVEGPTGRVVRIWPRSGRSVGDRFDPQSVRRTTEVRGVDRFSAEEIAEVRAIRIGLGDRGWLATWTW